MDGPATATPALRNIFYPHGLEWLPPVTMHYLHMGCWCTVAGGLDYFSHRQLNRGEVMGHQVHWLHTARPRDRFVFLVDPVEPQEPKSLWGLIWKTIYGKPPAFAIARGRLLWRINEESFAASTKAGKDPHKTTPSMGPKPPPCRPGVEAIEVLHSDVTAMDYAPGITSNRLALETKVAAALWFPSSELAYEYYGCLDKHPSRHDTRGHPHGDGVHVSNMSGLSDHRHRDGGEAMESVFLSREPTSTLSNEKQPPSPRPSPALGPSVAPAAKFNSGADSSDGYVLEDTLPPSLLLPRSSAAAFERVGSSSFGQPSSMDVSALSTKRTPQGSPEISHFHTSSTSGSGESFDMETLRAESAAAGLLHGSVNIQPVQTLKHFNTMVIVYTQDPHFNAVLREVLMPEPGTFPFTASVQEQKRLLSMYEAGMPSWTIFFSRYGLPYRRWFRLVAVMLVNLWPLIALCVGLYDLYKHMPYLKEFLADTLTPITWWMEHHFTLRISMLVTYLVTVSYTVLQALHSFVKSVMALTNFVFAPIIPVLQLFSLIKYPFIILWTTATFVLGPLLSLLWALWLVITTVLAGPFHMVWYVFRTIGFVAGPSTAASAKTAVQQASYLMLWWRSWMDFWDKVARPIKNVAKACYDGVVHLGVSIVRREASIRRWYTARLRILSRAVEMYVDCLQHNWLLFASLPSWKGLWVACVILFWSCVVPAVGVVWFAIANNAVETQ